MTHQGSHNEPKMKLRRLPWGALGASWVSWGVLWGLLGRPGVLRRLSEWVSGVFGGSHGVSWVAFGLRVGASLAK